MSPRVAIIGAGAAGLITAKTLLEDGFDIEVFTRDSSVGGVWAKQRVYPDLYLNNVHGEFRFSSLPMPAPEDNMKSGGRLTGRALQSYFESFSSRFLECLIRFDVEVLHINRGISGKWEIQMLDLKTNVEGLEEFDKVVLCSGGCSKPNIPEVLSPASARAAGFIGNVFHSTQFAANMETFTATDAQRVLVVGGGKSAQDIAAYAVSKGHKVTMIFNKPDAFIASPFTLPEFIRKSRFLSIMSPHIHLRTGIEHFLHNTTIGSMITHGFWNFLTWSSLKTFQLPNSSPFHNGHSIFWEIRTNDEGSKSQSGFFDYIRENKINIMAQSRARCFTDDGLGVLLEDGRRVEAEVVVLSTGYKSSWDGLLSERTRDELGLDCHHQIDIPKLNIWNYTSLSNPPMSPNTEEPKAATSIYRGIVPARNILNRDFAVNGSIFTTNNGYTFEVVSHWISSYFLEDPFLRLPPSSEIALYETQRNVAWLQKRYPGLYSWVNESYSSNVAFFNYPQLCDDLLEDMDLNTMRSGGNALTWPFKAIDLEEIKNLREERKEKRCVT